MFSQSKRKELLCQKEIRSITNGEGKCCGHYALFVKSHGYLLYIFRDCFTLRIPSQKQ